MPTLEEREAAFRRSLDPTLPLAEVEEAVTDWLRRQPEGRQGEQEIVLGQLAAACEAIESAWVAACNLGWDVTQDALARQLGEIILLRRAVENLVAAREPAVVTALPGRLIDGAEVMG